MDLTRKNIDPSADASEYEHASKPFWYTEELENHGPNYEPSQPAPPSPGEVIEGEDLCDGDVFFNTIKQALCQLLGVVVQRHMETRSYGCQVNHPSQRQHPCLYPEDYYLYIHFKDIVKRLWTENFIPTIIKALNDRGIPNNADKVSGACLAFLHELKEVTRIQDRILEILEPFCMGTEPVLNHADLEPWMKTAA